MAGLNCRLCIEVFQHNKKAPFEAEPFIIVFLMERMNRPKGIINEQHL